MRVLTTRCRIFLLRDQPNHDEVVAEDGETFGQFSTRVFKRHYEEANK